MSEKFDKDALEATRSVMGEKFSQLIEAYIRNVENYMGHIQIAIDDKNYTAIAEYAHPLKSASAMLGAIDMSETSASLEMLSKNFEGADQDTAIQKINDEFLKMKHAFEFAKTILNKELT